jgi:hypothetical protein
MRRRNYLILIFLFTAFSCHKKEQGSPVQNIFTSDSYPMAVGDWWQYQVTSFQGGQSTDTLILSVISVVTTGSSKDYKCNLLQNGAIIDSGHFIMTDSSLSYRGTRDYSLFGFFNLKFPFTNGQKWPGIYPGETIADVGFVDTFKALGVVYNPLYTLHRFFDDPHCSMVQNIFLTPKIGLVFQGIDLQTDTAPDIWESIQLMNYELQ